MSHVMNTYARQPVAFVRGQGVWLYDEAGRKYLDALAGIAVNTLGHNHPRLARALTEQIGADHPQLQPVPDAAAGAGGRPHRGDHRAGRGVLLQLRAGGATRPPSRWRASMATTAASRNPRIIVMEKAFHGRSLATLSATAQPQGTGRLRAAGAGLRARAAERPRGGAADRGAQQERGRGLHRADPGRRRHQRVAPRVPARAARNLRAQRMAVHVRRGAVRPGTHRQVVRLPARRLPARRGAARQGPRGRRAGGRLRGRRPRQGRVQARQPRLHLRRQPAGDARRGDHARHGEGGRPARERGEGRRGNARRAEGVAGRRTPGSSRSAAWA